MSTWPPLTADDVPDTRLKGQPHHAGLVVSQDRAITVAKRLFPYDIADGSDCHNYTNKPGEPCPICAERNQQWINKVREVRAAMMAAFQ